MLNGDPWDGFFYSHGFLQYNSFCSYACKSRVLSLECFQLALLYSACGRSDSITAVVDILVTPELSILNVFS